MVDGDATYDAGIVRDLVHLVVCEGFDLVNASPVHQVHCRR